MKVALHSVAGMLGLAIESSDRDLFPSPGLNVTKDCSPPDGYLVARQSPALCLRNFGSITISGTVGDCHASPHQTREYVGAALAGYYPGADRHQPGSVPRHSLHH